MARAKFKIWKASLATLQQQLDEGEMAIAAETNSLVRRPDGQPLGVLEVINFGGFLGDENSDGDEIIAINNVFVRDTEVAMLSLAGAKIGDVCVRTDLVSGQNVFMLKVNQPTILTNWVAVNLQPGVVTTVNGRSGVVAGLAEANHTHPVATTSDDGLMSAADKQNLNSATLIISGLGNFTETAEDVSSTIDEINVSGNYSFEANGETFSLIHSQISESEATQLAVCKNTGEIVVRVQDNTVWGDWVYVITQDNVTPTVNGLIGDYVFDSVPMLHASNKSGVFIPDNANLSQVVDMFSLLAYTSGSYLVEATVNNMKEITQLVVVHDGTNAFISIGSFVNTSGVLATYSVDILGNNVRLKADSSFANTSFKVVRTLIHSS